MTFEIVKRPTSTEITDDLVKALIETATTDNAIKVDIGSEKYVNWQSNLRNKLRRHGYRLRTVRDKNERIVTAWVEKLKDEDDSDEPQLD